MSRVVVLGASANPERYANKAVRRLLAAGHDVIPVNPAQSQIEGLPCVGQLSDVHDAVDTVTLYVGSDRLPAQLPALLALAPKRVIFNPGTENDAVEDALTAEGIEVVEGCTLVMLSTGTF